MVNRLIFESVEFDGEVHFFSDFDRENLLSKIQNYLLKL